MLERLATASFDHLPAALSTLQARARAADRAVRFDTAERVVAERGGTVVAAALVDRSGVPWRIVDLDVATEARRRGVGRDLVRRLLETATDPVELEADPLRPAAVGFWTAVGFVAVGPGSAPGAIRMRWSPPPAARPATD